MCADRAALEPACFGALRPPAKHGADACRVGVILLVYFSRTLGPPAPTSENLHAAYFNVRHGITAAALVYLGARQQAIACCWHLAIYIVGDPDVAYAPSQVTWTENYFPCYRARGFALVLHRQIVVLVASRGYSATLTLDGVGLAATLVVVTVQ